MAEHRGTIVDNENNFELQLVVNHFYTCVVLVVIWLMLAYALFSRTLQNYLEEMRIPKRYKTITIQSLWIGLLNLFTFVLCFAQLDTIVCPLIKNSERNILYKALYAATAGFCQPCEESSRFLSSVVYCESPTHAEIPEWTITNAVSVVFITAILIQEILLSIRNNDNYLFYSSLLPLIFISVAVKTRCPILGIQGIYLISANVSSREIARALVSWKAYSQEEADLRPSIASKTGACIFFVFHVMIWFSCIFFYWPYFLHQLPPVCERGHERLFVAYTYLAMLGYVILEIGSAPLWTTIRCLASCRRNSGLLWRVLALSDCHLLGHYSALVLELETIQAALDREKALRRHTLMQKHIQMVEGRRNMSNTPERPQTANFVTAVKTLMALKKKIARHQQSKEVHDNFTPERLPQVTVTPADSNVDKDMSNSSVETVLLSESEDKKNKIRKTTNSGSDISDAIVDSDAVVQGDSDDVQSVLRRRSNNAQVNAVRVPAGREPENPAVGKTDVVVLNDLDKEGKKEDKSGKEEEKEDK